MIDEFGVDGANFRSSDDDEVSGGAAARSASGAFVGPAPAPSGA
jgi:hypothetical protein